MRRSAAPWSAGDFATIATLMFVPVVFSMVHKKQAAAAAVPETSHAH